MIVKSRADPCGEKATDQPVARWRWSETGQMHSVRRRLVRMKRVECIARLSRKVRRGSAWIGLGLQRNRRTQRPRSKRFGRRRVETNRQVDSVGIVFG